MTLRVSSPDLPSLDQVELDINLFHSVFLCVPRIVCLHLSRDGLIIDWFEDARYDPHPQTSSCVSKEATP